MSGTTLMDITLRLEYACTASCTCMTKTPVHEHHSPDCRYRVLNDAIEHIAQQDRTIINQARVYSDQMQWINEQHKQIAELRADLQSARAGADAEIAALRNKLERTTNLLQVAFSGIKGGFTLPDWWVPQVRELFLSDKQVQDHDDQQ